MRLSGLLFILLLPTLTVGQSKVYVGVRGSGQLASAYLEHTIQTKFITTDFITGYAGGAIVKIFTKKRDAMVNPGLQTGLIIDRKGWGQVFPDTNEPKYKLNLSYVQLPMEAIINFGRGNTKVFFSLGWYLEYLLAVQKSDPPDAETIAARGIDFYTYESDRDRKIGYGGRFSVGGQKDFSFGAIHLDLYATFNISSVIDHQDFKTEIPDLSNLYTIGVSVGYLLPFGKLNY